MLLSITISKVKDNFRNKNESAVKVSEGCVLVLKLNRKAKSIDPIFLTSLIKSINFSAFGLLLMTDSYFEWSVPWARGNSVIAIACPFCSLIVLFSEMQLHLHSFSLLTYALQQNTVKLSCCLDVLPWLFPWFSPTCPWQKLLFLLLMWMTCAAAWLSLVLCSAPAPCAHHSRGCEGNTVMVHP